MLGDLALISLSTAPVMALGLLLANFLQKRYRATRLVWVWLILALRLLIPFRLQLPTAPVELEILPPSGMAEAMPQIVGEASKTVQLADILPYVWLIGAALVLAWHLGAYAVFRLRIRRHLTLVEKLPHEPAVYRCACIAGPMTLGYLRPVILLPEADFTPEELEAVLTHERAHYRRKDVWVKLLLLLACSVHWFNPLVWLMNRRAAQDLEAACDETVLRARGPEYREIYANAILKSAERSRK